jgi:flagellar basal body-associated protein FliL
MDTKKIQIAITVALTVVLCALVGGYIYYGMYLAKQGDVAAEVDPNESSAQPTPEPMSREQKMAILNSLNESSESTTTPALSIAVREDILNSLTTVSDEASSTVPQMSDDQKRTILESLNNNEESVITQ